MSEKFFFSFINEDSCFTLNYWKNKARELNTDIRLEGAKILYGENFFWCSHFLEVGETSESCGIFCDHYSPRNGKNGRCRFHKNTYEPNGKKYLLSKATGKLKPII